MNKGIWFSRHTPTAEQVADAMAMGFAIEVTPEGTALGSTAIQSEEDLDGVVGGLKALITVTESVAVFGVFAVPVAGRLVGVGGLPAYGSWNVQRTIEGGKPTFQHLRWVLVGSL